MKRKKSPQPLSASFHTKSGDTRNIVQDPKRTYKKLRDQKSQCCEPWLLLANIRSCVELQEIAYKITPSYYAI